MEFPKEYFVKLDSQENIEGRLTVYANESLDSYWVEIDLILLESRKIWKHIDTLYQFTDLNEAIDSCVNHLSKKLQE